jgi:hypothetical protein
MFIRNQGGNRAKRKEAMDKNNGTPPWIGECRSMCIDNIGGSCQDFVQPHGKTGCHRRSHHENNPGLLSEEDEQSL